jgi:hypothetical protein
LTGELGVAPVLPGTQVAAVDDKSLFATLHLEQKTGDGSIGDIGEGSANAAVAGIDTRSYVDIEDPMQSED